VILPDGKGLWARWPSRGTRDGAIRLALSRLEAAGVEHVAVEVLRQLVHRREPGIDSALVSAARGRVRLVPWAYLQPGAAQAREAYTTLAQSARQLGERWVYLDVEGPEWRPASAAAPLEGLIDRLHEAGFLVAVTSYGSPWEAAGWTPCLGADAGLVQLARVGPEAVTAIARWRERFDVVGVVAEPYMAAKRGLAHARLLAGLVDAMRAGHASGHLSSWVLDWYTAPRLRELGALEVPGRS